MCLISLKNTVNYKYIHVSPTSPTCILFTTLHCVHVSPTSPTCVLFTTLHCVHVSLTSLACVLFTTLHCVHVSPMSATYVPITVQRNYLPYKWQPGNAQFSCPLVVPYFSQSLGTWVPLPNMSTTLSYHSPSRHGCWCPTCSFRGVLFKQSCIQNKLHSIYYSTCTVKSLTPPTCVSFKLFNVLRVYVLYV